MSGIVDYSLAKRALVARFRRGELLRNDLCDAHPELLRAARHIGHAVDEPCPVCDGANLREIRYVFGDALRHLSGRVVYPDDWIDELTRDFDEFRCYTIEACTDCSWNHLVTCTVLGRSVAGRRGAPSPG
ncbi:MAG: DUF5318 family protein, partial [Actinomycetota bacterium]